jgi:hypothetical protein
MNSLLVSGILLASMMCGMFVGILLRSVLPDSHIDETAKDVIKMGTGLVAAVTGLVLALLTTSAKSAYDGQRTTLHQMSADIVLLDHLLVHFGPEGGETRDMLRNSARSFVDHLWPADAYRPSGLGDPEFTANATTLIESIRNLPADSESRQVRKSQALQLGMELGRARWQLHRWEGSSLPMPFLVVVNSWLTVLFLSFGLLTPRNATVIAILFVCALSVAGAMFLIVELDQPFGGLVRISSAPLRNALSQLDQ